MGCSVAAVFDTMPRRTSAHALGLSVFAYFVLIAYTAPGSTLRRGRPAATRATSAHAGARPLPVPPATAPDPGAQRHAGTRDERRNATNVVADLRIHPPPSPPSLRPGDAHPQIKLLPARVAG